MSTITGTCHFPSRAAAMAYYQPYGTGTKAEVEKLIKCGEIVIGPPTVKAGETVVYIDKGTRYAIKS